MIVRKDAEKQVIEFVKSCKYYISGILIFIIIVWGAFGDKCSNENSKHMYLIENDTIYAINT